MNDLFFIICLLPVAFMFYCSWKVDQVLLPYKTFNVFGKFKAYMFTNFVTVAFVGILLMFIQSVLLGLIVFIIGVSISSFIYRSTKSKCPDGPLKDKLMKNMIIVGVGSSFNTIFFFFHIAAKAVEPKKAIDDKGRTIYIFFDDNVYDESGRFVGKRTDVDTYIRRGDV